MFQQPKAVQPGEKVTQVGEVFGTPIVVKGLTWLPFTQLVVWGILAWAAGRDHPERSKQREHPALQAARGRRLPARPLSAPPRPALSRRDRRPGRCRAGAAWRTGPRG